MARRLRVEYPGAIYHVMSRGNRRQLIFREDADRVRFIETLGDACAKTDWEVQAYCLMGNHFHLVVETPQANLVAGMKWFLGTYTTRFNRRYKLSGHLFSGRYKALIVDGSGNGYLRTVCDYVHLNPVRAKLLRREQPLREFPWSSYGEYLKGPTRRLKWLRVDRLLGEMFIPRDSGAGRRTFERLMEERRQGDNADGLKAVLRGWCLGDEVFRQELLKRMSGQVGEHHFGSERQESMQVKAERIVREEMRKAGLREKDLERMCKGDARKVAVARRVREETTVSLKWIAARLRTGTWTYLNNRLYWERRRIHELARANM